MSEIEIDLSNTSASLPAILVGRLTPDEWTTIYNGTKEDASLIKPLFFVVVFFVCAFLLTAASCYTVTYVSLVPSVRALLSEHTWNNTAGPALFIGSGICAVVASVFVSMVVYNLVFGIPKPDQTPVERAASLQKFFASRAIATVLAREHAKLKTRVKRIPAHGRFSSYDEYQHVLKFSKAKK